MLRINKINIAMVIYYIINIYLYIICIQIKIQKIFFLEDEIKIKDLILKITSMRESLQSKKQTLEYKNNLLSKHLDHVVIFIYFLFSYIS